LKRSIDQGIRFLWLEDPVVEQGSKLGCSDDA
jgi:hypothetical protein